MEDVLQKWVTDGAALFVSTDVLLEALLAQVVSNNPAEGVMNPAVDNRFESMKRLIDTFLLAAKRITYPPLPMEVWTQNSTVSYESFTKVFPFAPAWVQCLPVAFQAVSVLHSVWSVPMRQSLETSLTNLTQVTTLVCDLSFCFWLDHTHYTPA